MMFKIYIYIFFYLASERERVCRRGGGAEAEGKGERKCQADSTLSAEPCVGLELTTPTSRHEPKPTVRRSTSEPLRTPSVYDF